MIKTLTIYDPAMCCSSGVCGPDVDTELVQLANFLKNLNESAVNVERYNLSQEPAQYTSGIVAEKLKEKGTDALPLVLIDGEVISEGRYPEISSLSCQLGAGEVVLDVPDCTGCTGCC
jgi:disulfide oxidoreductase YuzD